MKQCGLKKFTDSKERCQEEAVENLEVEISDGRNIIIPICKYHNERWLILLGHKGLALEIGKENVVYKQV